VKSIPLLEFASSFQRGGFAPDRSSMALVVEDLPPVIVVSGTFELGTSGVDRIRPDNSDLNALSQVLDNALLGLVEIILDLGTIVNSIPGAVVGTAGSAGGTVEVSCYTQVKAALGDRRNAHSCRSRDPRFRTVIKRSTVDSGRRPTCCCQAMLPSLWCKVAPGRSNHLSLLR
jgi:hypothetical protein